MSEQKYGANGKKLIKTDRNTRIPHICSVRTANMVYNGYVIGTISEERNDAGEFDWVIRVDWDNWMKSGHPQISGIDMDLRLDEYIRTYIPAFVTQRTIPDGRADLPYWLEKLGLTWNDRFEFMVRNHGLCGNNDITVERQE